MTGQGPPTGPNTGDLQIFGEGERKKRILLKGSPEHNLLKEAQVLETGGSRSQGQSKEGRGFSGSQARKLVRWPPDRREGVDIEEGNGKMVGPSSVGENPTSRAKEKASREPRARFFPKE